MAGSPIGRRLKAAPEGQRPMHYVYVLKSEIDQKLYIGCTSDVEHRLTEHNAGYVPSTKSRKPFRLIYTETFQDKDEAFKVEKFYKTATGKRKLKEKLNLPFHKPHSGVV